MLPPGFCFLLGGEVVDGFWLYRFLFVDEHNSSPIKSQGDGAVKRRFCEGVKELHYRCKALWNASSVMHVTLQEEIG